ncbi:DinB family protein [Streptomyces sp. NPDC056690]|uniref:DinB family protein n=1 Tax=unclassified Streptomyces TaxID=2593676 RepID=UPI0036334196
MSALERPMPPLNADERTTLESWLDFHRITLAMKCEGLDDEQAAVASVPPSGFTLTGLVQHMAEVERNWFRRVFAGEQAAPPIYAPQADPDAPDGGFELAKGATLGDAVATWQGEIARARENCADRALSDTGRFMDQDVNLRWIYVHMIEEYARHNGHADLVRERVDGTTGV